MRALRVIVGAAAVLLMVAGCGTDQAAAPADQPASSETPSASASQLPSTLPSGQPGNPSTPPGRPAPPQGGAVLPEKQVDTSNLPPYYDKKEVVVAPDGNSVTVWGMARDACSSVAGEVAEESATVVHIVLVPMPAPQGGPADQVCAQVLTPVPVTVRLQAPLGNRTVVVTEKETY